MTNPEQLVVKDKPHRKLAYKPEFRDVLVDFRGAIPAVHDIFARAFKERGERGKVYTSGNVTLTIVKNASTCLAGKVEIGGHAFLVKTIPLLKKPNSAGFDELQATREAKELIKDIPGVRIAEFQLGYQDADRVSYYVSKWEGFPRLDQCLAHQDFNTPSSHMLVDLMGRARMIKEKLSPRYQDVELYNMLYDEAKNEIILFDLNSRSAHTAASVDK